jgi:predicted phosphodiesterase
MVKVLVLSDTHGKVELMHSIIEQEKPDVVIHSGDYDNVDLNDKSMQLHKIDRDLIKNTLTY